jgi:enoyl-CoA hydratase
MTKTITLDFPGKNAFSTQAMEWLIAEVKSAGDAPLLITGSKGIFSAGMNLKEVAEKDRAGMVDFLRLLEDMCAAIFNHPAPTVAVVNGHAIAGGCIVALCCDRVIASSAPRSRIGLNEVALGLRFPPRILRFLQYRIPRSSLSEVILEAGLHSPESALRLGLVDAVSENADADAQQMLKKLGALPRDAYAACKSDLQRGAMEISQAEDDAFIQDTVPRWVAPELKAMIGAMFG